MGMAGRYTGSYLGLLVISAWRGKANMMTMEWHMAMALSHRCSAATGRFPCYSSRWRSSWPPRQALIPLRHPHELHVVGSRKGNRRRGARWRNVEAQRRQDREADRGQGSGAAAWLAR